jgi:hypothetical protein
MPEITVLAKVSLYLLEAQPDCQPEAKALVEVITHRSLRLFQRDFIKSALT